MELYNTLSRKKETLPAPDEQKRIRLFVCGPTVYDDAHIGHARTYLFFDFFAKYLRLQGYEVNYLQNITDIDDKIISRAAERNLTPAEIAEHFTKSYLDDMRSLGVTSVTKYAPATDFIAQIVAQVERLIEKGFAYEIPGDGWYFDIAKDPDYGKLSGRTVTQAEDGVSRIDDSDAKRNRGDFCLWKYSKPDEPVWHTRIGSGRPGWHIEDTAISEYYFGPQYEIHGGGDDLKFPHHEAEIAQQESASGLVPFVRWWVHTGFLLVEGKKMSKSLGNFTTIKEFLRDHPPEVFRWIVLAHHYRSPIDFSAELVAQARATLENVAGQYADLMNDRSFPSETAAPSSATNWLRQFDDALQDDLNTPRAIAVIFDALKDPSLPPREKLAVLDGADAVFGLGLKERTGGDPAVPSSELLTKFKDYEKCRANKQFIQSDALRKEIEALGYEVRDTDRGSRLAKKRKFF
jgi:cysteinyl-tRNA synthetase